MSVCWRIEPGSPLAGCQGVPADKSIAHRAILLAALAEGESRLEGLSGVGEDVVRTIEALRAMGVEIDASPGGTLRVRGVGLRGLQRPERGLLDCGNSGTTMRLLSGVLVAQGFGVRLTGDASLSRRPMRRIVAPLRARGAWVDGRRGENGEVLPPLTIAPLLEGEGLEGLEHASPLPSAQVKGALLLSGLFARGATALAEPMLSRDHTERALVHLGVPLQAVGPMILLDPSGFRGGWDGVHWRLPGDLSSASFLLVAALLGGGEVYVADVGLNPTRTGLLEVLREMGAELRVVPRGETGPEEPWGEVAVRRGRLGLRGTRVGGERLLRMIDEVPALAALAAVAEGVTEVHDASELRVKESDRIGRLVAMLTAFGVEAEELPDGLRIRGLGGRAPRPVRLDVGADHRIAMAATVLALAADGPSELRGVEAVKVSWPGFRIALASLGAAIEEVPAAEEGGA